MIAADKRPAHRPSRRATVVHSAMELFASQRSDAITVNTYKSVDFIKYNQALQDAITRVFQGLEDQQTAWDTYVAEVEAF